VDLSAYGDTMSDPIPFETRADLERWLAQHHDSATELLVRVYKKGSGIASVAWGDIVEAVLAWGWIDGQKRSLDDVSYIQRVTPRRAGSAWSKINVGHVERLIAEGRMQPSGLAHVEAAKADGRWDAAYAGQRDMVIPEDFLAALDITPGARERYDRLTRAQRFTIYHQLLGAKKPETRARRLARMVERLGRGELPG
tara:strand:+ start:48190 stop:48780 length:591 start_codon:yes stop_codon:yes gene_type:complete